MTAPEAIPASNGGDFSCQLDGKLRLTHTASTTKAIAMTRRYPLIDKHIGRRLRALREEREISLDALGTIIGVSYQQIQKYERGDNRMAAATLFAVALACATPVAWFFEGLDPAIE